MYTYEKSDVDGYYILDPDGDTICWVLYKKEAQGLLSHLNRE